MKYVSLIICSLLLSCSRQADLISVNNVFVDKMNTSKLEPRESSANPNVRAITLLSYPLRKDISNWSFLMGEESQNSWETFLNSISFRNRLITAIDQDMNSNSKIQEVVTLVQSAGESRDNAFKKMVKSRKELAPIDLKINTLKTEQTPKDLQDIKCFFVKRPVTGKNYECKSIADAEFKNEKTASTCKEFIKFTYLDIAINTRIQENLTACNELQKNLDVLQTSANELESNIASEQLVRSAGEAVVLDLLQSIEHENPGLVLLAVSATVEKNKDPTDPVSTVVISKDNTIEQMSLIIDFGPNLSSGSGKIVYSKENGNIRNLKFIKDTDGVWTLYFDIITSDFIVTTNLAYSTHPIFGVRFVGDANFIYANGDIRKGILKMEFDLK